MGDSIKLPLAAYVGCGVVDIGPAVAHYESHSIANAGLAAYTTTLAQLSPAEGKLLSDFRTTASYASMRELRAGAEALGGSAELRAGANSVLTYAKHATRSGTAGQLLFGAGLLTALAVGLDVFTE